MGPPKQRDSRQLGPKTLRSHNVLPISCIEIPAAILPSSSSVSGLIVTYNFCQQVTPGDPARGSRSDTAVSAAPLRVLLLPSASTLPCDTLPNRRQDVINRQLLQRGTGENAGEGAASTEAWEDYLSQASVLRLARQARLARELLAVGYQIAGVWLRIDEGEETFEEFVDRLLQHHERHQQHSLISSMTSAIVKANACSPQLSLVTGKKTAGLFCCFVFFSPRTTWGAVVNAAEAPATLGYYCSGSSAASLVYRRVPVVVRQAEHPQPTIAFRRPIVYSAFFPLQIELCFVPSKSFTCYVQACGEQLSAALASELYVNFAAVLSPPILASLAFAEPQRAPLGSCLTAWSSGAQRACDKCAGSSPFKREVCYDSVASFHEETKVHSTCKTPNNVTRKSCSSCANSASPTHNGDTSTSSKPGEQLCPFDLYVSSCGESAQYCWSTVLSGSSENAWDAFYGERNRRRTDSCSSLCFLQPLLIRDLVFRYEILVDFPPEPSDHCGTNLPVPVRSKFRVVPCDEVRDYTCKVAPDNSFSIDETEISASKLYSLRSPLILTVKGEFVAAIVASIDASVEHLRKSLAADAATAIARRIAERVADVCAAYCHSKGQPQRKPQQEQSVPRSVAALEVRRFYMVNTVRELQGGKQKCEDPVGTLLVSDFSDPEETPDAQAGATVERFEFLLGVPPAAVAPHSILKDGGAVVVSRVNTVHDQRIEPHELGRWHQQTESVTHMRQQSSAAGICEVRLPRAAVFWNDLEGGATREMTKRPQASGGGTSDGKGDTRRILLWATLVLLAIIAARCMLFP